SAQTQSSGSSVHRVPVRLATMSRKRALWIAACALLGVGATLGAYFWRSQHAFAFTDKDTIVIGDFENHTGDAVFDDTLKQALVIKLEESPYLKVISSEKIAEALSLMGQPADRKLTPSIAKEVCARAGSKAVINGAIANLGSQYIVTLSALS